MTEVTFIIGHEDKHKIGIIYDSSMTGKYKILVDGRERVSGSIWVSKKEAEFNVGRKEKHKVKISVGGMMTPEIDAFVDGELVLKIG